jgi:hypothetical protein
VEPPLSYVHLTQLDNPEKPWKRVYRCTSTGIHVKVHAERRNVGFGKVKWVITGSHCNEAGTAFTGSDGAPLIHIEPHGLSLYTDRGIRHADARDLLADFLNAQDEAALDALRRRARALFDASPSDAELTQSITEDFERECLFMVAKVERAVMNLARASNLGGVKPQSSEA